MTEFTCSHYIHEQRTPQVTSAMSAAWTTSLPKPAPARWRSGRRQASWCRTLANVTASIVANPSNITAPQTSPPPQTVSSPPHRERESAPVPTDIAEKMIALKRKQAKYVRLSLHHPNQPPLLHFRSNIPNNLCSQQSQGPRRTARSIWLAQPSIICSPAGTAL